MKLDIFLFTAMLKVIAPRHTNFQISTPALFEMSLLTISGGGKVVIWTILALNQAKS